MGRVRLANLSGDAFDRRMLQRAVALAGKGEGRVEPNPMVGCVIVRNERIIAEGCHRRFGGPHAEINALHSCTTRPHGATMYVSLEPCCHHGKTPPCCEAIIEAGISRVVIAARDPNPRVRGGGIRRLRGAGITVTVSRDTSIAAALLAPFLTCIRLRRPYVIAKWAQSLDGKLATRTGESKWISCETSRRRVHRMRARVDAILVGVGTVITDDPSLTARGVTVRRVAHRVVLDGRLRTPIRSQVVQSAHETPTIIYTSRSAARSTKASRLRLLGAQVTACATRSGRIVLSECLVSLCEHNVTNLLIEGGPTILSAFLRAGLVDEAWSFVAPKLIGGDDAPNVLGGRGSGALSDALQPHDARTTRSGDDTLHILRFTDPESLMRMRSRG